ncbi:hypothetical protein C5S35_10055 [Candidatus Methanophagaceae archaeon]|nr:hypothetical protein C5S35_10055 [Methanophagales archaeon]
MKTKGYKAALFLSAILVISAITSVQAVGPTIEFIDPTPANNVEVTEDYVVVNVSITTDNISDVWLDWNGTNYTMSTTALNIYTYTATNLTNGMTYTYKVYANDTSDNIGVSETRNVTINETTGDSFDLELGAGWNLISIPLVIDNTSINAVFPDANNGDELYAYDGGEWQIATYNSEAGWYGDFETVEPDKGYWYSATTAGTVTIEGTKAGTRTVSIAEGWNLIGYTRLNPADLNDLLVNVTNDDELYAYGGGEWQITTYNSEAQGWYGDMSTMEPGKGYWYSANTSFTWEY